MAEINRRLNIVDEVTSESGLTIYVHSTPVRREIFDQHYLVMTKTINRLYEEGIAPGMAARIALRLMRDVAKQLGDEQLDRVDRLLFPEIWRLTNVLVPEPGVGWQSLPFEKAIKDKLIDEDDADVIRNHLVFFTSASWVHTRKELKEMIYPMISVASFGAQIVSSSCTEYLRSLPTPTVPENTGETATASSTTP